MLSIAAQSVMMTPPAESAEARGIKESLVSAACHKYGLTPMLSSAGASLSASGAPSANGLRDDIDGSQEQPETISIAIRTVLSCFFIG